MNIPAKIVIAWSGLINEIPNGWVFCDGNNNTPDLKNRFIVGTSNIYALNSTGGLKDAPLISHNHTGNTNTTGAHTHTWGLLRLTGNTSQTQPVRPHSAQFNGGGVELLVPTNNHSHVVTEVGTIGESATDKNLPPYYALAFIMKEEEE